MINKGYKRLLLGAGLALNMAASAADESSLQLVPFPKEVRLQPGKFSLSRPLILEVSREPGRFAGEQVRAELQLIGVKSPVLQTRREARRVLRLASGTAGLAAPLPELREHASLEEYALRVAPETITLVASGTPGLLHGVQTLRQLLRANRQENNLPCLAVRDWPSLRWRAFQDDLTRGPSSTLTELEREADLGAFFKHNIFTYYLEHQYAFKKHPLIGPKDGSLTPAELKALVAYAQPLHLNILGNQQSFGHFGAILAHSDYAALRETPDVLSPVKPETYQLLDDLYSEQAPLLPFPFFNVCCDETDGLGEGPSKELAGKVGVGGVYVQHMQRIHHLIKDKYQKRMMMWGDIILRHPQNLAAIPRDTIMLSWGYDARASFDDQILPFARSGHEFFVCPGVNCWNRILPDFRAATTNVRNFVRDGLKQGAIGMLNTAWDDDGESLNAPNWHGFAWGAECAWTGSATAAEDFNRRLGGVLFGESAEHFGQAIGLLSDLAVSGLPTSRFWKFDFGPIKAKGLTQAREPWNKLLTPTRAAIGHLEACQKEAVVNKELLDFFLFGARRVELLAQRELDRLDAAFAYQAASRANSGEVAELVAKAEVALRRGREAHAAMSKRFAELWLRENKPYALDWTLNRYQSLVAQYDHVLAQLAEAHSLALVGQPIAAASHIGLQLE